MRVNVSKTRSSSPMNHTVALPPKPAQVGRAQAWTAALLMPGKEQRKMTFPDGLLGLPQCQHFMVSGYKPADGSTSPFFLLQCQDEDLSFPLLAPDLFLADYHFDMVPEILTYLKASSVKELSTLAIVTVRERMESITMNLQGPLVMNFNAGLGLQFILEQFPVQHPLFVSESGAPATVK